MDHLCLTCGTLWHVSRFDIQVSNYYKRHKHWFQEEDLDLVPENSAVVSLSLNICCIIFTFLNMYISCMYIISFFFYLLLHYYLHIICHYFRSLQCSEIHTIGKSLSQYHFHFLLEHVYLMYVCHLFLLYLQHITLLL